ncbi:Aldehyde Dehydrogenase [Caldalkalibacillus thermarum TA2.A1]|uniref:Aldehyde Dehydrogenase n=1 Tax=Caldalkalibacillus thermarum (strain TA2.A1) TaxID=986075 RepID=F5LA22_CALTT|nr:aldehyde dehydrogenase family protein [Caldalkalibacillus thermarum]EGL81742.1 Aldehyde Dehydrogenase [Caldalkalibacillus thermarum TA2.A1]QZT34122.1 aldehyde dehydrogenase family protein [Caldalkalibacillus thermarum TA2.A1]
MPRTIIDLNTIPHLMYINGQWTESVSRESFDTVEPATREKLASVPRGRQEDVDRAVQAARERFESRQWQLMKADERARMLWQVAQLIRKEKETVAKLECLDTGKPISQAHADVEAAARYFEYYAGMADKIFGETIPVSPSILDYTVREPVGVSAHIVPWNYPLQITARGAAAAIATGNTVVIKPAEDTPLTALYLAGLMEKAGFPPGVYNVVTGYGHDAGEALANHPDVDHITFTGSVQTGSKVMAAASRHIKPVTMELGGKSPNILFDDCDQEEALNWVVRSIVQNAGQTCSAGSRLILHRNIYDQFVEKVVRRMATLTLGIGINNPDLGPIINDKQGSRIEQLVEQGKQEGARILTGGERVLVEEAPHGFFFTPTVVEGVEPDSCLAQEEIFGPVLTVFSFEDETEAVQLANGTPYGLVAGIWTKNIGRAHRLAKQIRAGQIFINNYGAGGGVEMPFGGYKKSGFGREKGLEALRNYTQLKNVAVKIGD